MMFGAFAPACEEQHKTQRNTVRIQSILLLGMVDKSIAVTDIRVLARKMGKLKGSLDKDNRSMRVAHSQCLPFGLS